jgi:hypothetical protein
LEFHHFSSPAEFPGTIKTFLADAPLFLRPDYLQAVTSGVSGNLSYRYVTITHRGKIIAFYNFHLVNLSTRHLRRIFHQQQYSKMIAKFSGMMARYIFGVKEDQPHYLLICGSVLVSGPYYGWSGGGNQDLLLKHLPAAVKYLSDVLSADSKIVATVMKDFTADLSVKVPSGYHKVMMDPVMDFQIDPSWKSMEDYLAKLSAKYRLRYKNAMSKLSDIEQRYLKFADVEKDRERINQLYQDVQQRAPIRLISADASYPLALCKVQGSFLKAYYLKGKMIMFICGILKDGHLEAHHIGMDYSLNRSRQLYLNILYEFIREGIERKASHISFGRTALEIKSTIGARPVYFNAWMKMGNTLLNRLMGPFIPSRPSNDWVQRNPWREEI